MKNVESKKVNIVREVFQNQPDIGWLEQISLMLKELNMYYRYGFLS